MEYKTMSKDKIKYLCANNKYIELCYKEYKKIYPYGDKNIIDMWSSCGLSEMYPTAVTIEYIATDCFGRSNIRRFEKEYFGE